LTFLAGVADGAGISVLAGVVFVSAGEVACAGGRVTRGQQARCIRAFGLGALDGGTGHDRALVGQRGRVAEENSVAQVAVVQRRTVLVLHAVTVDLDAHAVALAALVCDGAGVRVVAGEAVRVVDAAACFGAGIVGAGVVVVAIHGLADAHACFAMVCLGAGISVHAFARFQGQVLASLFAQASVIGAVVIVGACQLIGVAIAVVVHAVAYFRLGQRRIAVGESLLGTNPLTRTGARFIGVFAGSEEGQFHGLVRASAFTAGGDALPGLDSIDGEGILARESRRAVGLFETLAAAEIAGFGAVVHANRICARDAGASLSAGTGSAEVGEVGDANEDHVGFSARNLLTVPAGRAIFLATLGAYTGTDVVYAPPGQTIGVLGALVEETAIAGLAGRPEVLLLQVPSGQFGPHLGLVFGATVIWDLQVPSTSQRQVFA